MKEIISSSVNLLFQIGGSEKLRLNTNGEIGILEGHEQTVATLVPGGLTIEHDNTRTSFAISGGILQITGEKVIVLGELVEKIDGDHEKAVEVGQELAKKAFPEE